MSGAPGASTMSGSVAAMPANFAQRPMAREIKRMNSKDSSRLVPTKVA